MVQPQVGKEEREEDMARGREGGREGETVYQGTMSITGGPRRGPVTDVASPVPVCELMGGL